MIDPKFKYVKAGDWIFTSRTGWTLVTLINTEALIANVETKRHYYQYTGIWGDDKHPTAWTYNPFDKNDKPSCEFKTGEVICFHCPNFGTIDYIKYDPSETGVIWHHARKLNTEERGL